MSTVSTSGPGAAEAAGIDIKPVDVDHLSLVRYVHATAMRTQGRRHLAEDEIALFCDAVHAPRYTRLLLEQDLIGAWIGGELVGTAGWQPAEDGGTARIMSVFVHPLFMRLGIAGRLLRQIEARARQADFAAFSLRAPGNAVAFFERHGYAVTAEGLRNIAVEHGVPITFMRKADLSHPPGDSADGRAGERIIVAG